MILKKTLALTLLLGMAVPVAASAADDSLVRFEGGIGVIPVSTGGGTAPTATTVNRNFVRGVPPPGQIWVIRDLRGEVKTDGRIRVHGRGLLLGGGNNIGGNANATVFATLICEVTPATTPATFTEHSTTLTSVTSPTGATTQIGVALEPDGDFKIDDMLDNNPPAVDCTNPALLIRNAANKSWFAAGIPRR